MWLQTLLEAPSTASGLAEQREVTEVGGTEVGNIRTTERHRINSVGAEGGYESAGSKGRGGTN